MCIHLGHARGADLEGRDDNYTFGSVEFLSNTIKKKLLCNHRCYSLSVTAKWRCPSGDYIHYLGFRRKIWPDFIGLGDMDTCMVIEVMRVEEIIRIVCMVRRGEDVGQTLRH